MFSPCRRTKATSPPRRWAAGATRRQTACRCTPQVPWFSCEGEAWAGRGMLAGLCVCCPGDCWRLCVSLPQRWARTLRATLRTTCSCVSCWAWAVLCSAWCTRCWGRSTRSPLWPCRTSSDTQSHRKGGHMSLVRASWPKRKTQMDLMDECLHWRTLSYNIETK